MKLLFSLDILSCVEVLNVKEKSEFWTCGNLTVCHAAYSIAHWEDHRVEGKLTKYSHHWQEAVRTTGKATDHTSRGVGSVLTITRDPKCVGLRAS